MTVHCEMGLVNVNYREAMWIGSKCRYLNGSADKIVMYKYIGQEVSLRTTRPGEEKDGGEGGRG